MRRSNRAMLLMAAAMLSTTMVSAATRSQTATPQPPQGRETQPPQRDGSAGGQGSSTAPEAGPPGYLSNELSRSQGVVRPPSTGDQGVVPPPSAGAPSTPVIPPPGTPGGNQQVQPK